MTLPSDRKPKRKIYFIVAGEASGDLHGARLIAAMKKRSPNIHFVGHGGDKMLKEGAIKEVKKFLKINLRKDNSVNRVIGINEIKDCSGILYKIEPFNDICMIGTK